MRILSKYTSAEDEEHYCFNMGYSPLSSGKIPMRELHERFQSLTYKKLYKVSAQKTAVRDSVKADTYFSNYDELLINLSELTEFEKNFPFYSPTPTEMLRDYTARSSELINSFLQRWWDSVINNVCNLKTVEGRQVRIHKEIDHLMLYSQRFSAENTALLNRLTASDIDLNTISKREKQGPVFDAEAERNVLAEMNNAHSAVDKHFALTAASDFYYKFRNTDRKYLDRSLEYCFEDIEILHIMNREYIHRELANKARTLQLMGQLSEGEKERYDRIEKYGFDGSVPAWKRICIIYENDGDLGQALWYCDKAIDYYKAHDMASLTEEFRKRREKLEKKISKQQNKADSDNKKKAPEKKTLEGETEKIKAAVSSKYTGSTDKIEDNPDFLKIHIYTSDNCKIGFVKIIKSDLSLSFRKLNGGMPQTYELSSVDDLKEYL